MSFVIFQTKPYLYPYNLCILSLDKFSHRLGPYGPILDHMVPNGPLWAHVDHMGPARAPPERRVPGRGPSVEANP